MKSSHAHDRQFGKPVTSIVSGLVLISMLTAAPTVLAASDGQQRAQGQGTAQGADQKRMSERAAKKELEHAQELVKGSKVIGTNVFDNQNKEIGEIKDLAIDLQTSRIKYVVVSTGGLMKGGKLVAMPPQAFRVFRNKEMVLDIPIEKIKQLPALPDKDWVASVDLQTLAGMYQTVGIESPSDIRGSNHISKATDIIDRDVVGEDQNGGKVKDLALDLQDGRVPFVIINTSGGVGGLQTKLVAVPSPALKLGNSKPNQRGSEKDVLRLSGTIRDLNVGAEDLDKNWEKTLADRSVAAKLYTTFGLTPYWTKSAADARAVGGQAAPTQPDDIQHRGTR